MLRNNLSNDDKARNEIGKKYTVNFSEFLIEKQLPPNKTLIRLLLNFIIRNQGKSNVIQLDNISNEIITLLVNQLGESRINLKSQFLRYHEYIQKEPIYLESEFFSIKDVYDDFIYVRNKIKNKSFFNVISSSDTSLRSVPLGATFNALKNDPRFV
jgi:hypothetical protein